ncbi:MAG: hypothetical protein QG597_4378 [Actinomycetota bacterium]|nr:hypothetical protein [Actinomycetota bacterium]
MAPVCSQHFLVIPPVAQYRCTGLSREPGRPGDVRRDRREGAGAGTGPLADTAGDPWSLRSREWPGQEGDRLVGVPVVVA